MRNAIRRIPLPIDGGPREIFRAEQRVFRCPKCGNVKDRDHNASINIDNIAFHVGRGTPEVTLGEIAPIHSDILGASVVVEPRSPHPLGVYCRLLLLWITA